MGAARQDLVNRSAYIAPRSVASSIAERANASTPQLAALRISSPNDAAEQEAERTAQRVVNMPEPAAPVGVGTLRSPLVARLASSVLQRRAAPTTGAEPMTADINPGAGGGSPLPPSVRRFMET